MKEKVEAIVLAAGYSSRYPGFKPLLKLGDKSIIERTIESIYSICSRIIVVCGYRAEDIMKILEKYDKVEMVINEKYSEGMFSSILTGAEQIKSDRFYVVPADMPMIKKETYLFLMKVDADIVIPVYKGKKGHPVLMNCKLIPELLSQKTDSNFKEFIEKKRFKLIDVNDNGVLIDIDTEEDYETVKSMNN